MVDESVADSPINEQTFIEGLVDERFKKAAENLSNVELAAFLSEDIVAGRKTDTSVISLVGGAASGKTTLSSNIAKSLAQKGVAADVIGTDDYLIGNRAYRREHFEGTEPKAKYDFVLMNSKIDEIRANRDPDTKVKVPTYDQASGVSIAAGEENYSHGVGPVDVLIVEGDFPEVVSPDLRIYLDVSTEVRLQNRLGRDIEHRSESDRDKIIDNFNLRQDTQHLPYTLPAVADADVLVRMTPTSDEWRYDVYRAADTGHFNNT